MEVKIKNKAISIKEEEIKQLMQSLDITEQEAIDTWLFDHDLEDNEEVEILSQKAKENKTDKIVVTDKTTRKKVERTIKVNQNKLDIINYLFGGLNEMDNLTDLKITNKQKLIEFNYNGKSYKLDLIEKREKKA